MIVRSIVFLATAVLVVVVGPFACSGQEQQRQDQAQEKRTRIQTLYDIPVLVLLQSGEQTFDGVEMNLRHQAGVSSLLLERLHVEGYSVVYVNPAFEVIRIKISSRDELERLQQFEGVTMVSLDD
ncbi:MAG: hypothetical protein ACPHN3_03685 [Spongiibacter sp.]